MLDKYTGVHPVVVGENWMRLFAKIVLKFTGTEATMAYQDYHLCAGLKVGIDGTFHGVQYIWDENLTTEDWLFLLIDANNAFNEINQV